MKLEGKVLNSSPARGSGLAGFLVWEMYYEPFFLDISPNSFNLPEHYLYQNILKHP